VPDRNGVVILSLQIASGAVWMVVAILFAPAIWRIWKAPMRGPSRPDPLDVLMSPLAFVGLLQVGFSIRWLLFPDAVSGMRTSEIVVWAGLYCLSLLCAVGSVIAWRLTRGLQ
jgi:hypothetical protein